MSTSWSDRLRARPEVQRLSDVAAYDVERALDAPSIGVHEAARLLATPQISISFDPDCFASITFRQIAAGLLPAAR